MSHIAIVSGSHRPSGNSPRIARHIEAELKKRGHTTFLLDLSQNDMPFWDEGLWGAEGLKDKWATHWAPLQKEFEKAEGLVFVAPEYHGIVPAKLMNLLLMFGGGTGPVAHKPALLVGVSATPTGGAYPVEALRAHAGKNNRLAFLPEHLLVRSAYEMFVETPKPEFASAAAYTAERLQYNLDLLEDYTEAFKSIRAKGRTVNEKFSNGM